MKAYTYQIGEGIDDTLPRPLHSESIVADSLGEAIDKAKAITRHRAAHKAETAVRIVESGADEHPVWASSVEDVRRG